MAQVTAPILDSTELRQMLRLPAGKSTHEHMGRIVPQPDLTFGLPEDIEWNPTPE